MFFITTCVHLPRLFHGITQLQTDNATIHQTETLTTFEYTSAASQPHSILFVGGLGDGLATTSYMADVVASLRSTPWSLFTLTLTSSYQSWGMGHLDRDTDEIATCLKYIKEYKDDKFGKDNQNKIVLMGHSTGSQCVLHYLHRENPHTTKPKFDPYLEHVVRVPLDGAIMQAPVSDREAIQWVLRTGFGKKTPQEIQAIFAKMEAAAREGAKKQLTQNEDVLMPLELTGHIYPSNTPLSCRRFLSLISPESPEKPAEDDLFSSDLSDEHLATTFGMIHTRGLLKGKLMAMPSGKDASVPIWVDKDALMGRWKKAADHNGKYSYWSDRSAQIPNGSHALSNDDQAEPRQFLCRKVLGFLGEIVPATTEEATDAEKVC